MKKERYEIAEIECIRFDTTDVIITSPVDEDEIPKGFITFIN